MLCRSACACHAKVRRLFSVSSLRLFHARRRKDLASCLWQTWAASSLALLPPGWQKGRTRSRCSCRRQRQQWRLRRRLGPGVNCPPSSRRQCRRWEGGERVPASAARAYKPGAMHSTGRASVHFAGMGRNTPHSSCSGIGGMLGLDRPPAERPFPLQMMGKGESVLRGRRFSIVVPSDTSPSAC